MEVNGKVITDAAKGVQELARTTAREFGNTPPNCTKLIDDFVSQSPFKIRAAKTKDEIAQLVELFVNESVSADRKMTKNPNSVFYKLRIAVAKPLLRAMFKVVTANTGAKTKIVTDKSGQIVGGFGYSLFPNSLHLGDFVLDSSVRKTKEGREILKRMGQEIKKIAIQTDKILITCHVPKVNQKLLRLYRTLGFTIPKNTKKRLYKLSVLVENFGNGVF